MSTRYALYQATVEIHTSEEEVIPVLMEVSVPLFTGMAGAVKVIKGITRHFNGASEITSITKMHEWDTDEPTPVTGVL